MTIEDTGRRGFLSATGALAALAALPVDASAAAQDAPPVAKRVRATDDYYGTRVADPYRWMENDKDPDLLPWLQAQDAYARRSLGKIPGRDALLARVSALSGDLAVTRRAVGAGTLLFFERQPAGEQNFRLYVRDGAADRALVDPTTMKIDGQHVSLDWWEPSADGKVVAYGLSRGGSEASTAHVIEVASGRVLDERIPNTDWGLSGWLPDGSGFFYVQLTGERGTPTLFYDSVVKLHRLGTDVATDPVVLKRGLYPQIPMAPTQTGAVVPVHGTAHALVVVADVRPERALWTVAVADLLAGRPDFRPVATQDDLVVGFAATGDDLYLLSNKDRPRGRVLVTSLAAPSLAAATEVLPQSQRVIDEISPLRGALLVRQMDGGVHRLVRVARGAAPASIEMPFLGAVRAMASSENRPDAHMVLTGWLEPPAVWRLGADGRLTALSIDAKPTTDLSAYVAERRFARARDGTQVPYTLIARRGWRADTRNPVLATAYGAYQYAFMPGFNPRLLAFLDAGGIYAVAHVRGGGEFGREWHKAGQKATKPNTWRDFIDVAKALIGTRVTARKRLVINGGSAGGIAVGRALTERPELFAGAISDVGWLNPMRYSAEQNNTDIEEWGPIVDAKSFRILYAMDTYHAVKDGTRYPPVLVNTGYNDPRVAMFHAAKFTARMQAATGNKSPVLLRIDFDAGHGIGSTRAQRDALVADSYAFVFMCAGVAGFRVAKA